MRINKDVDVHVQVESAISAEASATKNHAGSNPANSSSSSSRVMSVRVTHPTVFYF